MRISGFLGPQYGPLNAVMQVRQGHTGVKEVR